MAIFKEKRFREVTVSFTVEDREWKQALDSDHEAARDFPDEQEKEQVAAMIEAALTGNDLNSWHLEDLHITVDSETVWDGREEGASA